MNKIRSLHGLKPLEWDEELEKKASSWAQNLALTRASAELSGTDNIGELVYLAKGTSECQRIGRAVHEW